MDFRTARDLYCRSLGSLFRIILAAAARFPCGFTRRLNVVCMSQVSRMELDVTNVDSTTRESAALRRALITPRTC